MLKMSSFGTNTHIQKEKRNWVQQIVKLDSPVQRDCWKNTQWFRLYVVYGRENIFSSHVQKSPEWSFVRADCVKKKRLHQSVCYAHAWLSQVADDTCRCVKVGANAVDIRRFCSEDQWRILPWCASGSTATACPAGDLGRLHLAARQCSSTPRTRHNQTSWTGDTHVHCTKPVVLQ